MMMKFSMAQSDILTRTVSQNFLIDTMKSVLSHQKINQGSLKPYNSLIWNCFRCSGKFYTGREKISRFTTDTLVIPTISYFPTVCFIYRMTHTFWLIVFYSSCCSSQLEGSKSAFDMVCKDFRNIMHNYSSWLHLKSIKNRTKKNTIKNRNSRKLSF